MLPFRPFSRTSIESVCRKCGQNRSPTETPTPSPLKTRAAFKPAIQRNGILRHHRRPSGAIILLALVVLLVRTAPGQDSIRMSLAGADAAAARRKAASTAGYYNLKVGPSAWNFNAGLGMEFNDNIQLESGASRGDLIFRPEIQARMVWPVSQINSVNLAVGLGYSAYVENPEFSRCYVTPGSEVAFDVYLGDIWLNLHDRFSILEDSYQDPTAVGTANYTRLDNAAGLTAVWDLNRLVARLGYDHISYLSLQGSGGQFGPQPDGQSEVFFSSLGYVAEPGLQAGLELGGGLIHYSLAGPSQFFTDASQWNVGGFAEYQLSDYLRARASLGYTQYLPEPLDLRAGAIEFSGLYGQAGISHRVNQFLNYNLTAGRTVNFSFYGGTIDLFYARLDATWTFIRKTALTTSFYFEHGSQIVVSGEVFDRYGTAPGGNRG